MEASSRNRESRSPWRKRFGHVSVEARKLLSNINALRGGAPGKREDQQGNHPSHRTILSAKDAILDERTDRA